MPGDLITADWQVQIGSLLLTVTNGYRTSEWEGFESLPDMRTSDVDRVLAHGSYAGTDWLEKKVLRAKVNITADTWEDLEDRRNALVAALSPSTSLVEMAWRWAGVTKFVTGRGRRCEVEPHTSPGTSQPYATGAIEFHALDPLKYDVDGQGGTCGVAYTTGGLVGGTISPTDGGLVGGSVTPTAGGLVGGTISGVGDRITITNDGTAPCPVFFVATGPLVSPRINVQLADGTEGRLYLNANVEGGATATFDLASRAVYDSDGNSLAAALSTDSTWFLCPPGESVVRFFSPDASVDSGYLSATWRSTWY